MNVLILEDDKHTAEVLEIYISELGGFKVFIANNIREMNIILSKFKIDIALLDFFLPNESIVDAKNLIKKQYPNGEIKEVLMTASIYVDQVQREYDFKFVLKKPFDLDQLDNILKV